MRAAALVLSLAALSAGCTTMSPAERRAADEAQCRDYGFRIRNDAFAECLQRLDLDRRAAQRSVRASFVHDPFPRTRVLYLP